MPEEEDYDGILNSVETDDIIGQSKMERGPARTVERTFESAVKSNRAFNNPGGTSIVTTSIIDDTDISMRSHWRPGGGEATLELSDGTVHQGPKFEPGEKRKRKWRGQTAEKVKAVRLKLDECVLKRANAESRDKKVSIFVVNDFHCLAFRVEKGPLGPQILYVLDGDVYDGYNEQGIPDLLGMQITPDDAGNGWILGGEKIQLEFVAQFVNTILNKVARQQIT